ncbi:MAG: hypothetical protein HY289_10085 [Planctomycetes bacterium]|nr:hypothetical protein [Planctomycetota bacterium]
MPSVLPAWLSSAADGIRNLADRPWTLFLLLLALNAIARPCSSTAHDARLYSLQALNQAEHGAYADDVFLRYGSQDQFTMFSHLVGPIVAAIGLRPTFFVLYLVFNTLFIFALFRLIRTLVDDALIATVALIFLVTAPLSYGGGDIFTVHEQFFTPRINGMTFTLLALERILRGGFATALGLLLVGALMHPLMAFGGMLIWAGCVASTYLPRGVFVALLCAALVGVVTILGIPALGARVFGTMDDDWHEMIRVAVGYNYPDTWNLKDWLNLGVSFALPIAGCLSLYRDDAPRQRFFWMVTLAGAAGFVATIAASVLPYALLFQGQPYRVLWILKVLQAPVGFLLIARWSQSSSVAAKIAALALLAFFCMTHYLVIELMMFAIAAPISLFVSRMRQEACWYGAARGLALGAIGWMGYRWVFFAIQREHIARYFDLNEWVLFDLVSPILLLVVLCIAIHRWPNSRAQRWASATVALSVPVILFAAEIAPSYRHAHSRLGAETAFVADQVRADGKRPSVYCSFGRSDLLWIDARTTSYFSIIQTAGVMFNRRTAEELQRRAEVVAKFEMARQRQETLTPDPSKEAALSALFKVDFHCPEPARDDLIRLCREPGLDYVVIPHEFPGLYSAKYVTPASEVASLHGSKHGPDNRVFVYECQKVRTVAELAFSARTAPRER